MQNCREYKLLSLEERRRVLEMGLLFDVVRGRLDCPELLMGLALRAPARRTRHTSLFHVPHRSTKYGRNAVLTRLARNYNQLFSSADPFVGSKKSFKYSIEQIIREKRLTRV